ncbi:MAG: multidrug effflux MFS transporter [Proteobacteria bacterium]|nr:multidrug effflux MFS transporter [Pseudomonadota bacterium]
MTVPTRKYSSPIGSRAWIGTLAALTAVVALSVDMSLPAQPTLARTFHVPDSTAALTLSVFVIAFALAQLVVGFLTDAWGRRKVLLGGLAVFTLASLGCALSPSIELLIVWRGVQGIGAAAAPVVARAMVRDTQPPAGAARLLSTMLAVLAIAPMIAPTIGGALLAVFAWPMIFATLATIGFIFFGISYLTLDETLAADRRRPLSGRALVANYATFLRTPGTKLPMAIGCASFAAQFAYISDSPFVLMEGFGVSRSTYGIIFGSTALALMIGSITGGRMIRAGRSPYAMIATGGVLLALGGIATAVGTALGLGIAGFLPPMIVFFFGCALTGPSATAIAMQPVPQIAGTASAAIGFSTMTSGAIAGYLTTRIGGTSPTMFGLVTLVMGLIACALALATAARGRHAHPAHP